MKKFLLLAIIAIYSSTNAQIIPSINYQTLDESKLQTDLLVTQTKPFSFTTVENRVYFSAYNFLDSYEDLAKSDTKNRFQRLSELKEKVKPITFNDTISLGLIHVEFETIKEEAFINNSVEIINNSLKFNTSNEVFNKHKQTIIAPIAKKKKGLKTTFFFDENFFENNTEDEIESISVNFGDGQGFRTIVLNEYITIKYSSEGRKNLQFKVNTSSGSSIDKSSSIIIELTTEEHNETYGTYIQTVSSELLADLSIYGETDNAPGVCEYEIFLSTDSILDKPIFVVDGFDPSDTRGINSVYNMLSYVDENGDFQNLANYVREEEGFDVVIVNFPIYENENGNIIDGGADYIERNAMSLIKVIQEINALKEGNEQNVLIGPSMGGLITRYALKYMEENNLDHESRLWISVDSPHNGANVAMSIQYLMDYLGYGFPDIDEIKGVVEGMLRTRAAQQMLVDHMDGHGSGMPLTPNGAPGYFEPFQNRMTQLGYPESTRNISITNGSGTGKIFPDLSGTPVYPGYYIADGNVDAGAVGGIINSRLKLQARYMPNAGETMEIINAKAQAQTGFWVTVDEYSVTLKQNDESDGIDTAPGGLFDILGLLEDFEIDPEYQEMLENALAIVNAGYFNFIPTTSAMALYDEPDYYHEFNLGEGDRPWDSHIQTNPSTPFVNWFLADENEGHVKLTPENIDFVLCELIEPEYKLKAISTQNVTICEDQTFNSKFYFEVTKGCFAESILEIEGLPEGSSAVSTHDTITENTLITVHFENFPIGESVVYLVPDGKMDKAVEITVTVNPNVEDYTGQTGYSLDGGIYFTTAESATVHEGSDVKLQVLAPLYDIDVDWISPIGESYGEMPSIQNIQYGGDEEGAWEVHFNFEGKCNIHHYPSVLNFELNVIDPLAIDENDFVNLKLYPNPTNESISILGMEETQFTVYVRDLTGRIIKHKVFLPSQVAIIDLTKFSAGVYQVEIKTKRNKISRKVVKN